MKSLGDLTAETTYMGDLHLGCLKACLDHLGFAISTPWLAGTTGQTFVISEEAEERLPKEASPLVRDARSLYQSVCDNLWPVSEAFGEGKQPIPFNEPGSPHAEAADRLRSARDAEAKGLEVLEQIADAL